MATLWQRMNTGGGALVLGGLVLWAMAWTIDFYQHLTGGAPVDAHGHGGDALVRVNFPLSGFPLVVLGAIMLYGGDRLIKRGNTPLFVAGMLIALDGLAHAFAVNDHLAQPGWAAIFAVIAPAQIALGLALPYLDRSLDAWWWLATAALLLAYIVTRTVTFAPLGFPEPVRSLDIFSKFTEVVVLLLLARPAWAAWGSRKESVALEAGTPASAE